MKISRNFAKILICISVLVILFLLIKKSSLRRIFIYETPGYNCFYELESSCDYRRAKKGDMVSLICKVKEEINHNDGKTSYEMYTDSDKKRCIIELQNENSLDIDGIYNIRGYFSKVKDENGVRKFYINGISAETVSEELYDNENPKSYKLKIDENNAQILVPNCTEPVDTINNGTKKQEGNISVSIPKISFYKDYSVLYYIVSLENKRCIIKINNMHIIVSSGNEIVQDKDIVVLKNTLSSFSPNRSGIKNTDKGYDWIDDFDYLGNMNSKNNINIKIEIDYTCNFRKKTALYEFYYD